MDDRFDPENPTRSVAILPTSKLLTMVVNPFGRAFVKFVHGPENLLQTIAELEDAPALPERYSSALAEVLREIDRRIPRPYSEREIALVEVNSTEERPCGESRTTTIVGKVVLPNGRVLVPSITIDAIPGDPGFDDEVQRATTALAIHSIKLRRGEIEPSCEDA